LVAKAASFTTSYIVENDKAFIKALNKLDRAVSDFRIPFGLISKEFFQGNKKVFSLKGPGQYPDLADSTKEQKKREVGFVYPILKRTGRLESSLTGGNSPEAVNAIGKKLLLLGTTVPYAIFHQSDKSRTRLPLRKPVFISGPPLEQGIADRVSGRKQAWLNIIDQYISDEAAKVKK